MVAKFLEASANFQNHTVWMMYLGIVVFLYGIMFINYKRSCAKK